MVLRAMTSADLNQDGYDDLVAGAPGYSKSGHIQIGRVYIVYSNSSGLPDADLNLDHEADEILEGTKVRTKSHVSYQKQISLC